MNIALILAGGIGQRTGQDIPKQFICVDNKPIIVYTLENFQKCESIDTICVACSIGWEALVTSYANQFNITKLHTVVTGGENRFMSIYNLMKAISSFSQPDDIILVYDAVRPIITDEIINDAIEKAQLYGAAVGVIPCYDSMCSVSTKQDALLTVRQDRDLIFRAMGPDAVPYEKLAALFEKYVHTDTSMSILDMLLSSGIAVAKSKSSSKCLKLTTVEDIELFQSILNAARFSWLK